jgi:hypothetical protein
MRQRQLSYFTLLVDNEPHSGWYRVLNAEEIEVLGVGLMDTVRYAGTDPESAARLRLEEFVRHRARHGVPIPPLALPPKQPK